MTTSTSADRTCRRRRGSICGALLLLASACAHSSPRVQASVHVAPGTTAQTLGRIAVPTFEIEGRVRANAGTDERVVRRRHLDTMNVTQTFTARLVGTNLVVLDRQFVDARIEEINGGTSVRISDETAPTFGRELGAQTLIVGRYRFECSGELLPGPPKQFVRPDVVHRQSVQLRGFELETGRIIFDVDLTLDAEASQGKLLPRSLAKAAARRLWARLSAVDGGAD